MKAVIIGTGAGSLASAIRLRALGYDVSVFDRTPDPGGRARTFTIHGCDFDAGPTVITAPWLFDELFELLGERRDEAVDFLECDPWYRISFADGSSLDLVSSVVRQEEEIAKLSKPDAANYRRFLAHCERLYEVGYQQLGDADFSSFGSMLRIAPDLFKLGGFRSLWGHVSRYFSDQRVRQAFSLTPLLVGGNPLTTSAIYGLIHAMERRGGIWFAKGGTRRLIRALIDLAERHGVRFHYQTSASGFSFDTGGRVSSVELTVAGNDSVHHPCDLLVWGGDPRVLYSMVGAQRLSLTEKVRNKTAFYSMGLYVLYFKTRRVYSDVAHHTIVLSDRWRGLLKDVFHGRSLPSDPSLYLHRPAATEGSTDLENGDLFYVLAPVPHLGNFSSWERDEARFRETVISILGERVLGGLDNELVFAESVDPRYFSDQLLSPYGAGFSLAPLLRQSAWLRFHNSMDRIPNLFLCGAGVHPGGGLPGVVTSAKVVERLVLASHNWHGRDILA